MDDILAKKNRHLFLEEKDNVGNSFIANINNIVDNLDTVDAIANDLERIDTVADNIDNVNTVAENIDNVNTTAENLDKINQFNDDLVGLLESLLERLGTDGNAWFVRLTELGESILATTSAFNYAVTTTLTQDIASGATLTLPDAMKYRVGTHMLMVSWNGTVCYIDDQYNEVGSFGQWSTTITMNVPLKTGDKIQFRVVALADSTAFVDQIDSAVSNTSIVATGSTENRTLADRFADVVNVKDFGAKGNGVTDNSAAFVAAAELDKTLFVPDGSYVLTPNAASALSVLASCQKLSGFGDVSLALPQGIYETSGMEFKCSGSVSISIYGQTENETVTSGAVTYSGSTGNYTATMVVPDSSKFTVGMPVSLRQTSDYATQGSILNGTFRVTAVSENTISFPVHYHDAAYALESTTWSGTVIIYKTVLKHIGTTALLDITSKCKNLEIKKVGLLGRHVYGDSSYGDTIGLQIQSGCCDLHTIGATEFGVGIYVGKSSSRFTHASTANCSYGIFCIDFSSVHFLGTASACLCAMDGLTVNHSSSVFSEAKCFFSGNAKRGVWCCAGSSFFCEDLVYTCYNKQAGIYAKSNSSVWVGQGSEASYNYETNANDCPGYGCESDSLIMAYGTAAKYNGVGYSPGNGSVIDAQYSTADSNVNTNYYALVGGAIEAAHSICIGSQYGYSAGEGSVIRCKDAEVSGATVAGLSVSRCSEIRADRISVHDNAVGLRTNNLSDIYAPDAVLDDNTQDYRSGRNSVIYAGETLYPTYFTPGEGELFPWADNEQKLGLAGLRWSNVFAATGSVQTSDRRSKTSITQPSEALMRAWGKVNFKVFQFIDAVEKKGSNARLHVGVIAQDVQKAFAEEGLDASKYGLFCFDSWDDIYETVELDDGTETKTLLRKAGDLYGIRYEEALALECAYQRWLGEQRDAKIEALMQRISALENNQ